MFRVYFNNNTLPNPLPNHLTKNTYNTIKKVKKSEIWTRDHRHAKQLPSYCHKTVTSIDGMITFHVFGYKLWLLFICVRCSDHFNYSLALHFATSRHFSELADLRPGKHNSFQSKYKAQNEVIKFKTW